MEGLEEGTVTGHKVDDELLVHTNAVHPDALAEVHQVGRGVEPHLVACRLQDGGEGVRYRALAVGSRHMDGLEPLVGMAKTLVEGMGVGQALLISTSPNLLEDWGAVVEVFDGLLVIHLRAAQGCAA